MANIIYTQRYLSCSSLVDLAAILLKWQEVSWRGQKLHVIIIVILIIIVIIIRIILIKVYMESFKLCDSTVQIFF